MSFVPRTFRPASLLSLLLLLAFAATATAAPEHDSYGLYHFFNKLRNNQQVTVAAIGGSITMAHNGWARKTADLIAEAYPQSKVNFVNAGISGTGSNLGIFRLKRDVIDYRPDLVLVEFAVNDGGASDEICIRNLESIVVRLRQCAKPPAIVFVQAASRVGGNHKRHNLVAKHHRIMSVDMQKAIEDRVANTEATWDELFGDNVHPRDAGHAVYAQTLWKRMQAYEHLPAMTLLNEPDRGLLSKDGLILDGTMVVPNYNVDGWGYSNERINGWWMKYFQGSLQSSEKAKPLHIPFFGRTVGLMMLIKEGRGQVRVLIDGEYVRDVSAFRPDWYYGTFVHGELLENTWHVLTVIPIGVNDKPAIARIGYLLLEDQTKAPYPMPEFWKTTWITAQSKAVSLAKVEWDVIPTQAWQVVGPFGGEAAKPWENPVADLNADFGVKPVGNPDTKATYTGYQNKSVAWQTAQGLNGWVDMRTMYGLRDRSVSYAHVQLKAPKAGNYDLRIAADYFTYITANGKRVHEMLQPHGSPRTRVPVTLPLVEGVNDVWVTVHAGSMGYGFLMELPADDTLEVVK
ncbi:MAG: hypothetical protein CMJ19_19850 [Phycisphaeraceae bacterium]|nr:hypothetical protein [Phycisphaeraceae bacterium]